MKTFAAQLCLAILAGVAAARGVLDSPQPASDIGALLDNLRFRTPTDGGPVRSNETFELVQLKSIYQESYLYGGTAAAAGSILQGPWNTGPLQYLYRREGGGAANSSARCAVNSTVIVNGNIARGDLRKVGARDWQACATACESESRCDGWVGDWAPVSEFSQN